MKPKLGYCAYCQRPFERKGRGRPRKYHSDACRKAAQRLREWTRKTFPYD